MWLSSTRSRRRSYQSAAEMAWLICWVGAPFLAACILPQAGVARRGGGPRFAPTTRHAGAPVPGDQRLRLSALAACLLPGRRPPARVAAVLRAPLPDGRAEQLVLPAAQQGRVPRLARAGGGEGGEPSQGAPPNGRRVPLRREGQPLPDSPQAAQGAVAAARPPPAPPAAAGPHAGAGAVPAPAAVPRQSAEARAIPARPGPPAPGRRPARH